MLCGPESLKYLLSGPLLKKFANSYPEVKPHLQTDHILSVKIRWLILSLCLSWVTKHQNHMCQTIYFLLFMHYKFFF